MPPPARLRPGRRAQRGAILLLCVALVTAASLLAFAFALAAQGAVNAGETLVRQELARAAARMGARHAMRVAIERLAEPYANADWALRDFGHLDRDDAANRYPMGLEVQSSDVSLDPTKATVSPNPYHTNEDNVQADDRLFYPLYEWGDNKSGQRAYDFSSADKPWEPGICLLLNPGNPRWIEPGFHNRNGLAAPVRFTQPPATPPESNTPAWFDERWQPVGDRAQARYRLRYAVAPIDLGGHLLWGRQLDFAAGNPFDHASATPHEWDERIARAYQNSFVAMLSRSGSRDDLDETNGSAFNAHRTAAQFCYLGRGLGLANNRTLDHPGQILAGFLPGSPPALAAVTDLGIWVTPGQEPFYASGDVVSAATLGGPTSWLAAEQCNLGPDMAWGGRWGLTPFGRASTQAATPGAYHQGYSSCPWRINLLTAPPEVLGIVINAYLPQVMRRAPVTERKEFPWVGMVAQPWPKPPVATWSGTASSTVLYSPPRPSPVEHPGPEVLCGDFHPPELATSPFAGFASVAYQQPLAANLYQDLYPGPPADWEDYAAIELDPALRANTGTAPAQAIHRHLLGSQVNVFHIPDGAKKWTTGALDQRSRFNGGVWTASLDGTSANWTAPAIEPMRGCIAGSAPQMKSASASKEIGGPRVENTHNTTEVFYHRDSYWADLAYALGAAVTVTKALHQEPAWVGPASVPLYKAALTAQAKPTTIREVDRLFLAILGEWFPGDAQAPGSTESSKPGLALVTSSAASLWVRAQSPRAIVDYTCSANIRKVRSFLLGPAAVPAATVARKTACMERVLNDLRLSFFGANGTYADFRPLDFDGDGYAVCSGYAADHPTLILSNGVRVPARGATAGVGPVPDRRFSCTGFLAFDQVRFVRALVRGQVWDELRQQPVAEANLETVFTVDPDGDYNPATGDGLGDNATLYARWMRNLYQKYTPRTTD